MDVNWRRVFCADLRSNNLVFLWCVARGEKIQVNRGLFEAGTKSHLIETQQSQRCHNNDGVLMYMMLYVDQDVP